jgi:lipid A oxidase
MIDLVQLGSPRSTWDAAQRGTPDAIAAIAALIALGLWMAAPLFPTSVMAERHSDEFAAAAAPASGSASVRTAVREHKVGGYGGVSYTLPSAVHVDNPGTTALTANDVGWIGRPFKSPIYYGLRTQHWQPGGVFGTMIDFTHAKAISEPDDAATFSGTLNGQPVAPNGKVGDVFNRLEFSHGHNMVLLNGLVRSPLSWWPIRPYFGLGGGVSLPHTEIGLRGENTRTFEYQFAGFAGQVLAGIEVPVGRTSLFLEYKFTYAPYSVPLSQRDGHLLVTDVWRQFRSWVTGEKPPGGRLSTTLATHHGIGGVMVRVAPSVLPAH